MLSLLFLTKYFPIIIKPLTPPTATRVWGCQMDFDNPEATARAGIEALRSFYISIGMTLLRKDLFGIYLK